MLHANAFQPQFQPQFQPRALTHQLHGEFSSNAVPGTHHRVVSSLRWCVRARTETGTPYLRYPPLPSYPGRYMQWAMSHGYAVIVSTLIVALLTIGTVQLVIVLKQWSVLFSDCICSRLRALVQLLWWLSETEGPGSASTGNHQVRPFVRRGRLRSRSTEVEPELQQTNRSRQDPAVVQPLPPPMTRAARTGRTPTRDRTVHDNVSRRDNPPAMII